MDIVVVDEKTRQSVGRPRRADRLRELSGPALTRTPKPSLPSTSTIERTTMRNAAGDAHKVKPAVSGLLPV